MASRSASGFRGALAAVLGALALASSCLLADVASVAHAQDAAPAADSPGDRAQSFQAVTGPTREDVPGGPLLIAAYAIVWLAVFGYVFRLGRLHAGVQANLDRLEAVLSKTSGSSE